MRILFLVLLISLFLVKNVAAQTSALSLHAGLCNVRGETSDGIKDNYGVDFSAVYTNLFLNSPWLFVGEVSHSSANIEHSFEPDTVFQTMFNQTYLGVGFRYSTNPFEKKRRGRSRRRRRPRPGDFLPYVGFGFGFAQTINSSDTPEYIPPGYETNDGTKYEALIQLEAGATIRLTKQVLLEGYFISRTAGNDGWDGIIGIGDGKDWLIRGGLGLIYEFK
ncbi:hypothetical protein [Owenweeksia hongkongensis]|uniref:Outer membrane protein beta-barrel domain-containing protein n=1 Tax=Owenweeksia hongkongensis (strain DSM 17368 / CIP 108786 / JCM 12287 / NRRL B-23963 / UST20020801) TaxID=926562 RepID=G8R6K6_OWEHD|nr:hypothetical protein [Owenweeksia hongkongensis]AEV31149.1 hypothetical protein Oweho_0127 [Owenweeksia hongkongensis DSM 17368]